jgi:signal transduction histidine kinase
VRFVPIVLVIVALIGSVLVPARQTLAITSLLRQTTGVLAPARLVEAQLQSGLAEEIGALQDYALTGDTTFLERARSAAADDDARMVRLQALGHQIDGQVAAQLAVAQRQIDDWRRFSVGLLARPGAPSELGAAVRAAHTRYDAALAAMGDVSADLAAEALARDDRLRELEHFGLLSNAALVLIAFAALAAVALLTVRERRLAASLGRRADQEAARARQEAALRQAAEALAEAFTVDAVTEQLVNAAIEAVDGRGAFVVRARAGSDATSDTLSVEAVAGTDVPPVGRPCDFTHSYIDEVSLTGMPALVPSVGHDEHCRQVPPAEAETMIAVPLGPAGQGAGALFIVSARGPFEQQDVRRAAVFGHLAVLAYEKVRLLDEANQGRRKLERTIASRSRLIRGFSHDVKNPIGAADGYAALLMDGVYGSLNERQQESVARMRRAIGIALSLIEDLHELGRAETGKLVVATEAVDLAELVGSVAEEFQAAADAAGLSFVATSAADVPVVHTSRIRVRQIAANLVSNAIKYTDRGSVTLHARHAAAGPHGRSGDWVALEVSDTGHGIPSDKLEFIFEEFGRIGGAGKSGAGLGLAISRLLAEALGGEIAVASELGRGSTFTFWLPVSV